MSIDVLRVSYDQLGATLVVVLAFTVAASLVVAVLSSGLAARGLTRWLATVA